MVADRYSDLPLLFKLQPESNISVSVTHPVITRLTTTYNNIIQPEDIIDDSEFHTTAIVSQSLKI